MRTRTAQCSAIPAEREFLLWITVTQPDLPRAMKRTFAQPENLPTEAEIQHAAYLLWLDAGRPEGRDLDHWLAAKELLTHHHGRVHRSRRRAARIAAPAAGIN